MIDLWLPPKPAIIRPAPDIICASVLPGMFPAGAIASKTPLTSIVQQASSSGSAGGAVTITAPADIIAGDLLVLADLASAISTTPTAVIPVGFTQISDIPLAGTAAARQIISYKLATGSEASAVITGMSGTFATFKVLLVFRGNVPATLITVGSVNGEATLNNPTSQNVIASGGVAPLVVFGAYGAGAAVDPRTMSPAKDGEVACGTFLYGAWKIYNSSPANVSVDMDDEGTRNLLQSCYIQMAST